MPDDTQSYLLAFFEDALTGTREDEIAARCLAEIQRGADVNSADKGGHTPLILAAWAAMPKLVGMLCAKGADVSQKSVHA